MDSIVKILGDALNMDLSNVPVGIVMTMAVVCALVLVVCVVSLVIAIVLACKYRKYNKTENSIHMTGEQIARNILDANGLSNIKVKSSGSMLFGNSYSHYFKKVRLRRRTWKKSSVASLAMATEKSALAVLDKEHDPDMKKRVRWTPFIYFGPLAMIPLVIIGGALDIAVFTDDTNGSWTIGFTVAAIVIYAISFLMSIWTLKTEKKAQERSFALMQEEGLATPEEIDMCRKLFKLYNIEYINNALTALLEIVYYVLLLVAQANGGTASKN